MINVVEMYSNETPMWSLREKSLRRSLGELQVGQKKYYLLSLFSLGGGGLGGHFFFTGNLVGFSFHSFVPKRIEWIIWTLNKQSNNKFQVLKK
jgi:hypothetical protein